MKIKASIATFESDEVLKEEWTKKGHVAKLKGDPVESCPFPEGYGGMLRDFWLQGYNTEYLQYGAS